MAASVTIAAGFNAISAAGSISDPQGSRRQGLSFTAKPSSSYGYGRKHWKKEMIVRAQGINPEIRKSEEKVVDSVVVTELSKNITPYCRCWRSGTFPLCDGSHVKHNKATGDNVGPLLLKK